MNTSPQYHFSRTFLDDGAIASGFFEFIHKPTLSSGIYSLEAGSTDPQKPHTEDELYYVMAGKSSMHVGDATFQISTGDIIFVPAYLDHRFFDIAEDLKLLVFFSKVKIKQENT